MSSSNRSALSYVLEVTKGTTPATPAFKAIRNTSDTLGYTPNRVDSAEIRADRQRTDTILTDFTAAGNVGIELSFAAYDDFIEAAFQGTWAKKPAIVVATAATEISAVSTTTLTVASSLGTPYKAGMLVLTTGLPNAANNNILSRVASSTGTTVVFPAASFTAETAAIPVAAAARVIGFQGVAGDITATATGLGSTLLDFTTLGLNVGEWIKSGGDAAGNQFATAACNGWMRTSSITATAINCDILPAGWTTDAGATKTIQVFNGDLLTTGTLQRAFSFERQQQDLAAPPYELFKGCQVDKLSLTFKAAAIITGSFDVMGLTGVASTTRTAGATDVLAPAYGVMNASSNIGRLMEGGSVTTAFIETLGFDLSNNLARETAIGTIGAVNVRDGEIALTGAISAYFTDLNLLNKVLGDTATSLMLRCGRLDGNRESLVLDIPQAKLTGTSPVSAKNTSRMFTGAYDAYRHPVLGYTASAGRFWYLPIAS
jgi:hypothetical protein